MIPLEWLGPGNDGDGQIPDAIRNLVPDPPNDNFNIEVLTKNVDTVRVVWHLSLQFVSSRVNSLNILIFYGNKTRLFGHHIEM